MLCRSHNHPNSRQHQIAVKTNIGEADVMSEPQPAYSRQDQVAAKANAANVKPHSGGRSHSPIHLQQAAPVAVAADNRPHRVSAALPLRLASITTLREPDQATEGDA